MIWVMHGSDAARPLFLMVAEACGLSYAEAKVRLREEVVDHLKRLYELKRRSGLAGGSFESFLRDPAVLMEGFRFMMRSLSGRIDRQRLAELVSQI
ncbi:MAG: hypothetical protein QW334_01985 [Thermofilum sp.]